MRRGFTIVELMMVVAVVSILAAIAVPAVVEMQLKAKRAELPSNVEGMKVAWLAYEAANDISVAVPWYLPDAIPGKTLREWDEADVRYTPFNAIGFAPDGDVRGSYRIAAGTEGLPMCTCGVSCGNPFFICGDADVPVGNLDVCFTGSTNLDGDLAYGCYVATDHSAPHMPSTNYGFQYY